MKNGENEGEIYIETNTGLTIDRKKRNNSSDYKSIKENGKEINSPESFLRDIFTDMQLNPVEFINMSNQEQNRAILELIEFNWDLNWIKEQFGEIPNGIDYSKNILQVLEDIQSEKGEYFIKRQDINREIKNKVAFIEDIAKDIPEKYDVKKWEEYDLTKKLKELMTIDKSIKNAKEYSEKEIIDITELQEECDSAETMKKHLNEYNRMKNYQDEVENLKKLSEEYTKKN